MSEDRALAAAIRFADGVPPRRIMLMPAGRVRARAHDGRDDWHNRDVAAVVEATKRLGGELPIDYEHQGERSRENGQPAPAAGWIKRVYAEAGAVWGDVEWTTRAAAMIEAKEYRFVSPVFGYDKQTRDVKMIVGAALTNDPALAALAERALARAGGEMEDMDLETIKQALGLPMNANMDEIHGAIMAMKNELDELRDERAMMAVDKACTDGQLPPAQREWGLAYARRDMAGFREFVRTAAPFSGHDLTRRLVPPGAPERAPRETGFRLPAGRHASSEGLALAGRVRRRARSENVDFATALARETGAAGG